MPQQKKILLFSSEPGGAEVLIPVCRSLLQSNLYDVTVLARAYAKDRFARAEIPFVETGPIVRGDTGILEEYDPDYVITSATNIPEQDRSETDFWENCRKFGVPALAFLDQWQNYSLRFFGQGPHDHSQLPDYINCINQVGQEEMVAEGFPAERLVQFGQPYLTSVIEQAKTLQRDEIRDKLGLNAATKVYLFVSEPISEYYGKTWGYDQFDAADRFLQIVAQAEGERVAIVKMHPKDDLEKFHYFETKYPSLNITFLQQEATPVESVVMADEIYGMTSIMLLEAFLLGRPVVSLQPNLAVESRMVLSRFGYIRTVINDDDQVTPLEPNADHREDFKFRYDADRFLDFLAQTI